MTEQEKKRIREVITLYADTLEQLKAGAPKEKQKEYEFATEVLLCVCRDQRMYSEDVKKDHPLNTFERIERQRAIEILNSYINELAERKESKKDTELYAYSFALNIVEAIRKDIAG